MRNNVLTYFAVLCIAVCMVACGGGTVSNPGAGIQFFEGNFQESLEKSASENKLVFMHAYADWCGYCKKMDRKVYTNEKVGTFFNDNYVNIKVNMEKGEGPELAYRYGVTSYPTLFILDDKGNLLKKAIGYQNVNQLLSFAK